MTEVGDRIVQQFATRLEELLRDAGPAASAVSTAGTTKTLRGRVAPEPEAIDLGAAALPVLLRKAAAPTAAVLFAVVVLQVLRRRSRR